MVPDIKWIKLATSMPDDEKIKLIDAMLERDTIHYLWIRLLIQAGITNANGEIFLSDGIPCTPKMLSVIFARPIASIKLALKTLSKLGMIEIDEDHIIKIVNWNKYQSVEGMDRVRDLNRKRAENHRKKKKLEKVSKEIKDDEETIEEQEYSDLNGSEANQNINDEYIKEDKLNSDGNEDNVDKSSSKLDERIKDESGATEVNKSENEITNEEDNFAININGDNKNDNVTKIDNLNNSNQSKNSYNVTQNENNVTVTKQNKKEIENKDINLVSHVNNKSSTSQEIKPVNAPGIISSSSNPALESDEEDINSSAMKLMLYYEKITGQPGGGNSYAIRKAIDTYGEKIVKMALDTAFNQNHIDIKYINGILKNWEREGYPKDDMEVKKNGVRSNRKSEGADTNKFAGFKPKEPRKLTEAERKRIEANLI